MGRPPPSSGLLRAFWILLVLSALTTGHVYSFRMSLPGRFPRDVLPHVLPGVACVVLGGWLAASVARSEKWRPRHVLLALGSAATLAAGAGLAMVHRSGSGTVDITSPPLELALAVGHFAGAIVLLVGAFRTLRKDYLDRIPR